MEEEGWWWLDCRFLSLSLSLVGGHGLRSGRETLLVAGFFFFFFFLLWFMVVASRVTMEVAIAVVLVFVVNVYYYLIELFILF